MGISTIAGEFEEADIVKLREQYSAAVKDGRNEPIRFFFSDGRWTMFLPDFAKYLLQYLERKKVRKSGVVRPPILTKRGLEEDG
jgi:hypothetical protein